MLQLSQNAEKICFLNFYLAPVNLLKIQSFDLDLNIDQEVTLINGVFSKFNHFQNSKQYVAQLTRINALDLLHKKQFTNNKLKSLNLDSHKLKFLKIVITHPLWAELGKEINYSKLDLESTHEAIKIAQKLDSSYEALMNTQGGILDAESVINNFYYS